ncbi:exodeoxyribonuclease VII large subunit [Candidatus Saccharibacteria bacterium]|nr:exodeoxyribonuclease VII large subunit [Candidatus Saccharibacteria bacterium]
MDLEMKFSVSEFLAAVNQTLEYAYSSVVIEGEVSGFKINQGKWVFFDLKDEESSISCFLPLFSLRMELADGMKIVVRGEPKVTKWGKFSLTVRQMMPVGEGSIKKNFELLKKKLTAEGLFDPAKKRGIPEDLTKIGVISSTQAAGYADFCKIINARWGGLEIQTAHTQVQGMAAADQIIKALKYFNEKAEVDIIAIMRGGGSADDLSVFNDEALVRAIAASRIPVITGIGHEVDESLADLAADIRASTPSNVAEMLTPDKRTVAKNVQESVSKLSNKIVQSITGVEGDISGKLAEIQRVIRQRITSLDESIKGKIRILESANPDLTLKRGYAIVSGDLTEGNVVKITTFTHEAEAKINKIRERKE